MGKTGVVDVLSDVLAAARLGRPHSSVVTKCPPFGDRFPAVAAAGFHVVLQGTCWLIPAQGEPAALGPGDIAFLPRGSEHGLADGPVSLGRLVRSPAPIRFRPDDEAAAPAPDRGFEWESAHDPGAVTMLCGAYMLDRAGQHPLLDELPDVVHLPVRIGRDLELRAAVEMLGAELKDRSRPGADAALPALLDLLLLYILRTWFGAGSQEGAGTGWAAALRDPAVGVALHAIHREPGRPWTVEELGRQAGLSRAAFARRFTALLGRAPLAYLTWWRMVIAAGLLRGDDAPVETIARRVGYGSQHAFTHAFKRQYGVPPGAYRKRAE
jgi:AraC-like DNA-binding protein